MLRWGERFDWSIFRLYCSIHLIDFKLHLCRSVLNSDSLTDWSCSFYIVSSAFLPTDHPGQFVGPNFKSTLFFRKYNQFSKFNLADTKSEDRFGMERSIYWSNRSSSPPCCSASGLWVLLVALMRIQIRMISFQAVLRIHDILGWIRIRIRGSMPLTNGPGFGSGSWIRILLFSSLTFKMPAKN